MTKKRILNVSSRKKRNVMLTISNTTDGPSPTNFAVAPLTVSAANGTQTSLWLATAANLIAPNGTSRSVTQEASRTATTCYMRGLSEHIRVYTTSGLPWFWRRICFTSKGTDPFQGPDEDDTPTLQSLPWFDDNARGMERLFLNQNINNMPETIGQQQAVIFKGALGVDWSDPIIAHADTSRISVKFDKTWTIKSGNAVGTHTEKKLWHPMNHNLVYDDDQSGEDQISQYISTTSKAGMGDYYIYDIFSPLPGGQDGDRLIIRANSTLYWHEK